MAHQCAAIHTWCKKAVAESSSATAVVSVPNLRSKAPTHHQVFWLMQPGAAEDLPKRPARLPAFSWALAHNGRLSAQSRAAANTATGEAPDSHRVPSNPPATQRSGARDDDTMYAFICTKYHAGLQLSMSFSLPAAFSRCPPKIRIERNPLRRQVPEGGGCGYGPAPG